MFQVLTFRTWLTKADIGELSLSTSVRRRKGIHRICPRCGKVGSLIKKKGSQVYYPQAGTALDPVSGKGYRLNIDDSGKFDKNLSFKVRYREYEQWCIAHYESGGHRWQCSLTKGRDYKLYTIGSLPRLKKPEKRQYQRKKDLRFKDGLDQKISQIKNNGVCDVRERSDKKAYRLYLF